jgi:magnesium chelatase accessory protein
LQWAQISTWPNAELSRQVLCPPHRWHVQEAGTGDLILLLHGAGGATHSFRDMVPLLAQTHHVIALDLPGQGFTRLGARHRSGLRDTAEDIATLCAQEGWQPTAIVGHSAGAALALDLSRRVLSPRGQAPKVIGINAALDNFKGLAGVLFPVMAKMLAAVPFTASLFAASAKPARVKALIRSTGSEIDSVGLDCYGALMSDRDHVDSTLMMMAHWSLNDLLASLPSVPAGTLLITGANDQTVPPDVSERAATRMPDARHISLHDYGHLLHEENPQLAVDMIRDFLGQKETPGADPGAK